MKIWFQNRRTKWKKQENISNAEAAELMKSKGGSKEQRITNSKPTSAQATEVEAKPNIGLSRNGLSALLSQLSPAGRTLVPPLIGRNVDTLGGFNGKTGIGQESQKTENSPSPLSNYCDSTADEEDKTQLGLSSILAAEKSPKCDTKPLAVDNGKAMSEDANKQIEVDQEDEEESGDSRLVIDDDDDDEINNHEQQHDGGEDGGQNLKGKVILDFNQQDEKVSMATHFQTEPVGED